MKSCEIDNLNQIIACNENKGSQLKNFLTTCFFVIYGIKGWKNNPSTCPWMINAKPLIRGNHDGNGLLMK